MTWLTCCLYVQLGLAGMQPHPRPPPPDTFWKWDITQVVNPYGTVEIGLDEALNRRLDLEIALRHISSIPVNDFGSNTAEIRLRYYPFREGG